MKKGENTIHLSDKGLACPMIKKKFWQLNNKTNNSIFKYGQKTIWIDNKYMKRYSKASAIKEIKL